MWVAIYNGTLPGLVEVEEFRNRASVAIAVAEFVADGGDPSFIGLNVGWVHYVDAPEDKRWSVDTDAAPPALVSTDLPEDLEFEASSKMADLSVTTTTAWEDVDGLVTAIGAITLRWDRAIGRAIGQVKVSGSGFEMRIVKGDPAVSMNLTPYAHPDTGGAWQIFAFQTDDPPDSGLTTYRIQARLNGATSADLRFTNLSVSAPKR